MEDTAREIVGFLSRWCLLALSLLTVAGVSWTTVLATTAMTADLGAEFVLPDVLCRRADNSKMLLLCHVVPPLSRPMASLMFATMPRGGRQVAKYRGGRYHFVASRSRAGEYTVKVRGTPYGGLAFCGGKMKYHVVAAARQVFLIDAAAMRGADTADRSAWRRCLTRMKLCGSVALIVEGDLKFFRQARSALRSDYGDVAILHAATDMGGMEPQVRRVAWWLDPDKLAGRALPQVITSDADLAGSLARRGLTVHLVSSPTRGDSRGAGVRQYRSLAELEAYLANLPREEVAP